MKIIWDLGLNDGSDALFYLKKDFKVIGIEADPNLCENARKGFHKYIESGQLILEECAIWNYNTDHLKFIINKSHRDWNCLDITWNEKYESLKDPITVKGRTLSSLLEKYGDEIYYMKIDLEGYDLECIKQLKGFNPPQYLSAELLTYNNISDKDHSGEMFFVLKELGYTKFQLVDQSKNHLVKCPNPSKEGNFVPQVFTGLHSGLFGKELPDKWVDIEVALYQYLHFFYNKTNPESWWDLHVTY